MSKSSIDLKYGLQSQNRRILGCHNKYFICLGKSCWIRLFVTFIDVSQTLYIFDDNYFLVDITRLIHNS